MVVEFDKPTLKELREKITMALNRVGVEYGIMLSIGNIRYDKTSFTTKLTGKTSVSSLGVSTATGLDMQSKLLSDGIAYRQVSLDVYISPDGDTATLSAVDSIGEVNIYKLFNELGDTFSVTAPEFRNWVLADRSKPVTFEDFCIWVKEAEVGNVQEIQAEDRVTYKLSIDEDVEAVDTFIDAVNTRKKDFLGTPLATKVYQRIMRGDYIGATKLILK